MSNISFNIKFIFTIELNASKLYLKQHEMFGAFYFVLPNNVMQYKLHLLCCTNSSKFVHVPFRIFKIKVIRALEHRLN